MGGESACGQCEFLKRCTCSNGLGARILDLVLQHTLSLSHLVSLDQSFPFLYKFGCLNLASSDARFKNPTLLSLLCIP